MKKLTFLFLALIAAGMQLSAQGNAILGNRNGRWVGNNNNVVGEQWCIHPTILNNGTEPITSLGFTYTLNDGQPIHKTQQLYGSNIIQPGKAPCIPFFFDPVTEAGTYSLKVTLDEINGGSNSADPTQCTNAVAWNPVFKKVAKKQNYTTYCMYDSTATKTFTDWNQTKKTFMGNIFVSAEKMPELAGKSIIGIRMTDLPTSGIGNFHFMKANVNNEKYNASLGHGLDTNNDFLVLDPKEGVAEAYFADPVILVDDKFHTGWSFAFEFDVTESDENNAKPIAIYSTPAPNPYAYIHLVDGGDLRAAKDYYNEGQKGNTGALPITLLISEPNKKSVDVRAYRGDNPNAINTKLNLYFSTYNDGMDTTNTYAYTARVDDGPEFHGIASRMMPPKYTKNELWTSFEFPMVTEIGKHQLYLRVDSVDGILNPSASNEITAEVEFIDPYAGMPEGAKEFLWGEGRGSGYMGMNAKMLDPSMAMLFKDPKLVGKKLVGLRIGYIRQYSENFKLWYSTTVTGDIDGEIIPAPVINKNAVVFFKNPVTLTEKGIYVGVSFELSDPTQYEATYPFPYLHESLNEESFLVKGTSDQERYYNFDGTAYLIPYITGDFPEADLTLTQALNEPVIFLGDTAQVNVNGINNANLPITDMVATYQIDGETHECKTILADPIPDKYMKTQRFTLNLDGFTQPGKHVVSISISKVNGQDNPKWRTTIPVTVNVVNKKAVHRPIMEEGTGTWCGWCPRGVVATMAMAKQYPEFICAVYHVNDVMSVPGITYPDFGAGLPGCTMDRLEVFDPYFGSSADEIPLGIAKDYEFIRKNISPATIDMATEWNEAQNEISIATDVSFLYQVPGESYKLAYIVTCDELSNPADNAWKQNTGYSGNNLYRDDPWLGALVRDEVDLSVYNHVVIAGENMGIDNSLPQTIEENKHYTHNHKISLANYKHYTPDLAENVKVIALVLNSKGQICNAREVEAGESTTPDPIEEVSIDNIQDNAMLPTMYYDLQGRRVANPGHGIYIQRVGKNVTKVVK